MPVNSDEQNLDAYVIIEGENIGTVLFTEKDSKVVNPSLNPIPTASGMIGLPEPTDEEDETGCNGNHYHGTLFNEEDPDSKRCGWGRVTKIKNPTALNINLASFTVKAINRLLLLKSSLEGNFTDFNRDTSPEAAADLTISLDEMNDFLDEKINLIEERLNAVTDARNNNEISSIVAKKFISSLGCAQRTAKDVIRRIRNFNKRVQAGEKLDSAADQRAINRMLKRINTIRECLTSAQEIAFN